jgi:outer membrane receptor protein involved in Fe transport
MSLMRDVTKWGRMDANGDESGYFNNEATGEIEFWQRQFSPEEMGGLRNAMVRSTQKTFSVTTGFKGNLAGNWDYEAALSHSQYQSRISWAQIIAAKANDLFLGPQLGVDDDGFPIYNADPSRLYRPLTRAEYDSIAARTTYTPKSRTETAAFTLTNSALFGLPGGDAGFAATVEVGQQAYSLNPDPLATQYYYYSWKDSDGQGSRNRWATAAELRMPLHETVNLSVAGRYDQYRYSGHTIGKATWSGGLEWRPIDTLLVRGSYGTAFRAPDLHYVFAGPGNDETTAEDLYSCRADGASDCSDYERNLIRSRTGNRQLDPETSTSWSAGFVWSPAIGLDLSVDWFDIDMRNQVQDMDVRTILANEANCRLGSADITSPTCVDALDRITRTSDGRLYGVRVAPINVARESTSGIDVGLRYRLQTGIGDFILNGTHTWVKKHDFQRYPGDRPDQFAVNSGFDIPRTKTSLSVTWRRTRGRPRSTVRAWASCRPRTTTTSRSTGTAVTART